MKKKITQPDGTVIEFEGTAEELAQLEKPSGDKKNESSKTGKRILNEESVTRMIQDALTNHERTQPHAWPQQTWPVYPPSYPQYWWGTAPTVSTPNTAPQWDHTIYISQTEPTLTCDGTLVPLTNDTLQLSTPVDEHGTAGLPSSGMVSYECILDHSSRCVS